MYNSAYTLTMTGAGKARYLNNISIKLKIEDAMMIEFARFLGHYTSSIQFDRGQQVWRWLDMKEGKSVATRT